MFKKSSDEELKSLLIHKSQQILSYMKMMWTIPLIIYYTVFWCG